MGSKPINSNSNYVAIHTIGPVFIPDKLMDGIDKMMTIERLYYNWSPSADGTNYQIRLVFLLPSCYSSSLYLQS